MICLTVIARNEARCLARCLDSARPFVDEMLVVDTGSTDDTCAVARACGARVLHFTWIDDFSAARNFALAQTTAPWRLVLDADEWIESGGDSLRAITGANLTYTKGTDTNLTDATGTDTTGTDTKGTDATGTGAKVTGASLTDAKGTGAKVTGASLTDAKGTDTKVTDTKVTDTKVTGANLTDATGTDTKGTDTKVTDAKGTNTLTEAYVSADAAAAAAPFVGEIVVRSAFDDAGHVRHAPSWLARFLPRGVTFRGRIHEQVAHDLPVRRLPLVAGHDGYRRAQQDIKGDRNERLLRRQIAETPADAYLNFQLGKDLQVHERFAEACELFARARALLGWPPQAAADAAALAARCGWLHDLVVREIFCRKRTGQFAAAVLQAQEQAPWWQHSPDFHFAFGDLLLDFALAEPQRAAQLLPVIEASWMRCLELGERPDLEGAVEGRGSYLAARNLAAFHAAQGNATAAAHFRQLAARDLPARDIPG